MMTTDFKAKFTAMAIGNIMEYFDFAIFGAFADVIGINFFPHDKPETQLLKSLSVFGAAFIMRPIGGFVIGFIGDKYGRKRALECSIGMMITSSFLIGTLPGFSLWGYLSTILLVIFRLVQGLAVGGEVVGAFIFTLEATKGSNQGFWGAACKSSGIFGTTLGIATAASIRASVSENSLVEWGWRIPFLISFIFGIIGMMIRNKISENPCEMKLVGNPATEVFKRYKWTLIVTCFIVAFWGVGYYSLFIWMSYFVSKDELSGHKFKRSWDLNFASNLLLAVVFPCFGYLSDLLGFYFRDPMKGFISMLKLALVCSIFLMIPAFLMICSGRTEGILLAHFIFILVMAAYGSALPAYMVAQYEPRLRYSGMGIAYNIAQAIFSGTAPIIQTSLVLSGHHITDVKPHDSYFFLVFQNDSRIWPAYYIISIATVSLFFLHLSPTSNSYQLIKENVTSHEFTEKPQVIPSCEVVELSPPVCNAEVCVLDRSKNHGGLPESNLLLSISIEDRRFNRQSAYYI